MALVSCTTSNEDRSAPHQTTSCTLTTDWRRLNSLRGFLIHDGVVLESCRILIVGEEVSPRLRGVALTSADLGRTTRHVGAFDEALHIRSVVLSGDRLLIAGDKKDGRALLLATNLEEFKWKELPLPADVTDISAMVAGQSTVVIGARTTTSAALLLLQEDGPPKTLLRIEDDGGHSARLNQLVASAGRIVAAGTDGRAGIAMVSHDDGMSFTPLPKANFASSLTSVGFIEPEKILAGGYAEPGPGERVVAAGVLHLGDQRWERVTLPQGGELSSVWFRAPTVGFAALSGSAVSPLIKTLDTGKSWEHVSFPDSLSGATIERLRILNDTWSFAISPDKGLLGGPL